MPIELKNSVRNSLLYPVTASGKCVTSRCQRPGPGACHGVCVVIVLSAIVIVFSFLCHWRDHTELLHQTQVIRIVPMFPSAMRYPYMPVTVTCLPVARRVLWVLELYHAHAVLARVDEPGHPGEADIGNAVLGLESWQVVVFDLHAASAQFADLGPHIGDAEGRLRLLVLGPHAALRDH